MGSSSIDIAVVGASAAGLFAAIHAARSAPGARVVAFDGATKLGAKILVAGGGRCNVTHAVVDERQYAGSTPAAIKKVLRAFDVEKTVTFFREQSVQLKREETGKLFPVSDRAQSVLDALLSACHSAGVQLQHPARVERLTQENHHFVLSFAGRPPLHARRVILATGGMALPKSGSDGAGYEFVRMFGHSTTARIFPALVPLTLPSDHPLTKLSGIAADVRLELQSATGKRLRAFDGALLCTHFGVSGPVVLDISRYYLDALADARTSRAEGDAPPQLVVNWLPSYNRESLDAALLAAGRNVAARWLQSQGLPERLSRTLCEIAAVDSSLALTSLTRQQRRALVEVSVALRLPIAGHRGFTHAEVTAGGVPLSELELESMESRKQAGLYLCGEILDVDGRIGGFNFQWAWASGYLAGCSAGAAFRREREAKAK